MLRSAGFPSGLPNLSETRQEKVTPGNALPEVAIKLCQAQSLHFGSMQWRIHQLAVKQPLHVFRLHNLFFIFVSENAGKRV